MSAAGALPCSCCAKLCTCKRSSAPFVEGCGARAPVLKVAWELTAQPLATTGDWSVHEAYVEPGGSYDHTGVLADRLYSWSADLEATLYNPTGEIDAGPLAVVISTVGSTLAPCTQSIAGLYAKGSAHTFANGPVEFDTLTATGMPYVLESYAASGTKTTKIFNSFDGSTTADTTESFDVPEGSYLAYTAMTWSRLGDVSIRLRTGPITAVDPIRVAPLGAWTWEGLPNLPYNQAADHFGTEIEQVIVGTGAGSCVLPSEPDVPPATDDEHTEHFDDSFYEPATIPFHNHYEWTGTGGRDWSYRFVPGEVDDELVHPVLARVDSLTVAAVDDLPDNPGCRDCDRAYQITITNPHNGEDPNQVTGIFAQRCLSPEIAGAMSPRDRPFPFTCQWYRIDDMGSPTHVLTKVGPQLWRLEPTGFLSDDVTTVFLKGTGDCPTTITESMFFAYAVGGDTLAGRYTISIETIDAPEWHDCFCDDGCGRCDEQPETLAADPCPDVLPPVPMERTSPYVCSYAGYFGDGVTVPDPDSEDLCAARIFALAENTYLTMTIVSVEPPPQPDWWNVDEYNGVWPDDGWSPSGSNYPGAMYELDYHTGPTRYGQTSPFEANVQCTTGGPTPEHFFCNLNFGGSQVYDAFIPWDEVIGDHTIVGHDGSTIVVRYASPTLSGYRAKLRVIRDMSGGGAGVRKFELRYGESTSIDFTDGGWMIVARKPCAGGPLGTYDVTEIIGSPPCTPTTVDV
jgi:hypothetical protein